MQARVREPVRIGGGAAVAGWPWAALEEEMGARRYQVYEAARAAGGGGAARFLYSQPKVGQETGVAGESVIKC